MFAPLANLYEHRLMGVVASASFDAGEVQIKYAAMSEKSNVVMPECEYDPETSCQAKVIVVAYFRGVGQREQGREGGLPFQELVFDLEDLGGGGNNTVVWVRYVAVIKSVDDGPHNFVQRAREGSGQ